MRAGWLVVLTGCNAILGLESTKEIDASDVPPPEGPVDAPSCSRIIADGDFDGDGIPNAVDKCPFHFDPGGVNGPDGDGDGVGDACDPDPHTPVGKDGECILLVDDFQTISPCWEKRGWTQCIGGACSGPTDQITTLAYDVGVGVDFVEVAGTITDPGTQLDAMVQIVLAFDDANGLTGTDCRIADDPLGNFVLGSFSWNRGSELSGGNYPLVPGRQFTSAPVTIRWVPGGTNGLCVATAEPPAGHTEGTGNIQQPMGGRLAIRAQHAAFRIEKLVAYGTGGHCR